MLVILGLLFLNVQIQNLKVCINISAVCRAEVTGTALNNTESKHSIDKESLEGIAGMKRAGKTVFTGVLKCLIIKIKFVGGGLIIMGISPHSILQTFSSQLKYERQVLVLLECINTKINVTTSCFKSKLIEQNDPPKYKLPDDRPCSVIGVLSTSPQKQWQWWSQQS